MDWGTVAAATGSSVVSGGLIGGVVSYLVSKRESDDRKDALALERDKWEHEKASTQRQRATATLVEALELVEAMRAAMWNLGGVIELQQSASTRVELDEADETSTDHMESILHLSQRWTSVATSLVAYDFEAAYDSFSKVPDLAGAYVAELQADADAIYSGMSRPPSLEAFDDEYVVATDEIHKALKAL